MTLDEAGDWKVPPWELVGGSPLLWHLRFKALRAERASAQVDKERDMELNALLRQR